MILADDLKNPEAPVLLPDGTWVLTEMHLERGWVLRINGDGSNRSVVAKTGRPNGITLARSGELWVAETLDPPALLRVTLDGSVETILTGCEGEPFLFPNDLRFGPDGALYMTDSGIPVLEWHAVPDEERASAPTDGRLYRIDVTNGAIRKLDSGLPFANGIAFGPDNNIYVAATQDGMVYKYAWSHDGRVSGRMEFGSVLDPSKSGFRGGDGIAFGRDGLLYATVSRQGDVAVMDQDGAVVDRIVLDGPSPTNLSRSGRLVSKRSTSRSRASVSSKCMTFGRWACLSTGVRRGCLISRRKSFVVSSSNHEQTLDPSTGSG